MRTTARSIFGREKVACAKSSELAPVVGTKVRDRQTTGNVLIVMAWASRRVSTAKLLRNWAIVYVGNLVGALGTTVLVVLGGWYRIGSGSVGSAALATASSKVAHTPVEAFFLGQIFAHRDPPMDLQNSEHVRPGPVRGRRRTTEFSGDSSNPSPRATDWGGASLHRGCPDARRLL